MQMRLPHAEGSVSCESVAAVSGTALLRVPPEREGGHLADADDARADDRPGSDHPFRTSLEPERRIL